MNQGYLQDYMTRTENVANDSRLSLSAKGLYLVIRNLIPFSSNINLIKKYCDSEGKEILSAITELALYGYIKYSDIKLYLNSKSDEEE